MPWSVTLLLVLAGVLALPVVGEYVAVLVLFLAWLPLHALKPLNVLIGWMFGMQHWLSVEGAVIAALVVAVAAFFGREMRLPSISQQERDKYLNLMILTLGVPVLAAFAFVRAKGLFSGF
jgi:hydrogenase-4 membrane subunit HyfE